MDRRSAVTVCLALFVALHGFAGAATAQSSVTVSRASAAASSGDQITRTLTTTFEATSNRTVTVNGQMADGNVEFAFQEWTDLDGTASGSGTSWQVRAGHEYELRYEATVPASANAGYHTAYTADGGAERKRLTVRVTEPQFGFIDDQDATVVFESKNTGSATKKVDIPNTGEGQMRPSEVTFSNVPDGFTVNAQNLPDRIDAGGTKSMKLQIEADESVSKGNYQFRATVTDNLGNSQSFDVSVTVAKPAVLDAGDDGTVDVGDVLVGSDKTVEFTVSEEGGYTGISGVTSKVTNSDQYGSIGFSGLRYLDTSPDGSATAEVSVSVQDNAPQHSDLRWTAFLKPDGENSVGKKIEFTGRVIYPARFGSLSTSNTSMVFDQPRSEVDSHTKTIEVMVPNTGDKKMNIQGASAGTDSSRVTASVVDAPDTIAGQSNGKVAVRVEADPSTPQGDYGLSVSVNAEEAGSKQISRQISVSHGVELSVEKTSLTYGDVIVTKNLTKSTDVAEALEYRDVSGLSVTKVSGPDKWLTVVERPPATLTAGDAAPFVVALRFDTSAELYRKYTWTYRVEGDNVQNQTVTVTATPKPYSFDQIRDPLNQYTGSGDWQSETASGMVTTLDTLESELRNGGEVSRTDLSTSIAAGRATLLFIESVQNARETRASDGNEAAQDEVVRAAATYNLLDNYVSKLDDSQLRNSADKSRAAADETVQKLVSQQTDYYRSQLDSGNVSMIERAHIKRQLAQLASLQGNDQRAERLRTESAAAFDAYTETVKKGNEKRQSARQLHDEMRDEMLTVVAGQPLMLNPAKWDAFGRKTSAVQAAYGEAATAFRKAGATEEAQSVADERQRMANRYRIARYSLYGSTAAYVLGFVGLVVYLVRSTYAYVRDAREAVSGDFLVAS
ncbi:hypothetical protein M0R88_09355 [Halorussus gelatinilyticus]|uniref:Uncharacterized protein n=1 Tax=Halorussus gelatinilyticus TaxID=2937524 RepID=A0A8U0IQH8_9EURY|nr:hypothetical protein [Halorussus gelatinilyticus]UPW02279.1 hypothetical protein M0R88_09355 [Halorussus gelatinilyticus]